MSARRLAGAVASLGLGLLATEVVVRALLHVPAVAAQLPCDVGHDALCGHRTLLNAKGLADHAWDPDRGWRNLPSPIEGRRVDADGLRVHPDPGAGTPGRPVVALVGDSFTYGDEVPDDVTFAARLAAARPDLEVRNLGVPGYGHDQMLLQLRALGPRLGPDWVVIGYVSRDVERDGLSVTSAPKPWFELEGDQLVLHGVPAPRPTAWATEITRSWWTGRVIEALLQVRADPAEARARTLRVAHALLDALVDEAHALGAQVLVVRLPTRPEEIPVDALDVWAPSHGLFDAWCATGRAPCLDLLPTFRAAWDAGVDTTLGGHWNPRGHAMVAAALAEALPRTAAPP